MKKLLVLFIFFYCKGFSQQQVKIGDQIWMVKNLNVDRFNNGDLIPEAKSDLEWKKAGEAKSPAWCYTYNDPTSGNIYGKLYNWYAVNDPRGISPPGWRIPEYKDFNLLSSFVTNGRRIDDNEDSTYLKLYDLNSVIEYRKTFTDERSLTEAEKKITNETGFSMNIFYGRDYYGEKNDEANLWSKTDKIETSIEVMGGDENSTYFGGLSLQMLALVFDPYSLRSWVESKSYGYPVRCLKIDNNIQTMSMDENQKQIVKSYNEIDKSERIQQLNSNSESSNVVAEKYQSEQKIIPNDIYQKDQNSIKVIKVKGKSPDSQYPSLISIYDEDMKLKLGDNVLITQQEQVQIPGKKKKLIQQTVIGNAIVVEEFNKPIYTVKLNSSTAFKMKDYKDGDPSFLCVKSRAIQTKVSVPRIMVIPKKIKQELFSDGEYQLKLHEKVLISALKNKFEDNGYTTIGFESAIKKVIEDRLLNTDTKVDLKTLILESSGADFYVEFEMLSTDGNDNSCNKVVDFKIRNYANSEDVASDIKSLNACGSPEIYKGLASEILTTGAISKINNQYKTLVENGRKTSVNFTINNTTQVRFEKPFNGLRLEEHIEKCIQQFSFNGNYLPGGVVSNRMSFLEVSIPFINEENGQNYSPNTFALDIIKYLKEYANIECEKSVIGSNINIIIK